MTLRNTLLVSFLIGSAICVNAQGTLHKKADKYFHDFQYASAAKTYEQIIDADTASLHAMERLAICYDKLNDPEKAEVWLEKICNGPNADAADLKLYAQVLAETGKYEASAKWYQKYLQVAADDHAANTVENYKTLDVFFSDSSFYKVTSLKLNSSESDFSPAFFQNGILFCSARKDKKKGTYAWDNSAFIDLYWAKDTDSQPVNFGKPVNSQLHEGPSAFSVNEDTLYFTRNEYLTTQKDPRGKAVVRLKIYYTTFANGEWQKEKLLPVNQPDYSSGHPAIAPDGKLYFVSDDPKGFGGTDIYFTQRVNGNWSLPENLGPAINTPGNEMFPFIDSNGDLYFASNTHPGLGGLDVFQSKYADGRFASPKNLGFPINSSRDDFGLIIRNNSGYFSSNRGNNPKDDNIYEIVVDKSRILNILAVDEKAKVLNGYTISISTGGTTSDISVDGSYSGKFDCENEYVIEFRKDGYLAKSVALVPAQLKSFRNNETITATLSPEVKVLVLDLQSTDGKKLKDGLIEVIDKNSGQYMNVTTDKNGVRSVSVLATSHYEFIGSMKDYKNRTIDFTPEDFKNRKNEDEVIISLMPAAVLFEKNEVGETIELEIKYDVSKATIRPDAARELDKLVVFMKKNTNVKVELGSHTDSRGSNEANLKLSQRRAESAVRYLVAKGINSKRLIPIGYGEDDLKVTDATTEEDHQHNRRTTVKIVAVN